MKLGKERRGKKRGSSEMFSTSLMRGEFEEEAV